MLSFAMFAFSQLCYVAFEINWYQPYIECDELYHIKINAVFRDDCHHSVRFVKNPYKVANLA